MTVSPQLQQTHLAVVEDHPLSPSIISREDWDMVESLSEEDLSDILPCSAYTHVGQQLREEEHQQCGHDNIKVSREEDDFVKQKEFLQRQIPALPTKWSLEQELLEPLPLPDLHDCISVEGSLSASTTNTCAAKSGEAGSA